MLNRHIQAALERMTAARDALTECYNQEPLDLEKAKPLLLEWRSASHEYAAAVDAFVAASRDRMQSRRRR